MSVGRHAVACGWFWVWAIVGAIAALGLVSAARDRFFVGSALLFTSRVGIADQLLPGLTDYVARLGQRPAFQRAFQRTFG